MGRPSPASNPLGFFAAEVRRLRDQAGWTQVELADTAGYSPATIAAVETCRLSPSEDLAKALDGKLQAGGLLIRLQVLVEESGTRPWFKDLVKIERKAVEIRTYSPYAVPGLLQTERYARCCARALRPALTPDEVEEAVALRLARQQVLARESPPRLWAIIEESVLRRLAVSPEIMSEQMRHLIKMSERPNIVIQVVPESEGPLAAVGRAFTILTEASGTTVVYLEDLGSARYVRKQEETVVYAITFDHLRTCALRDERSVALIREAADNYAT